MFDQLTWSLGMFVQSAFLILGLVYGLRRTKVVEILIFQPEKRDKLSIIQSMLVPALLVVVLYLLVVTLLWQFYGDSDSSAIDWAVVVLLIGVLTVGPAAGCIAATLVVPVRAVMVFWEDAEAHTLAEYSQHGFFPLSMDFWQNEMWIWLQPEVSQLIAACASGAIAFWFWRQKRCIDYPLYLGIPLGLAIQGVFTASAISQWGYDYGVIYLVEEAIPSAIALAVAVLLFLMTLALVLSEYERRRAQAADLVAAQDQLRFLNAQINPHFLNNALNAISGVMVNSPETAQTLLSDLGDYFRTMCADSDALVPVSQEVEWVDKYVSLEKARFGQRLIVKFDIDKNCQNLLIPRMVLQPLVENAIRHGVEQKTGEGVVNVSAQLIDGRLRLTVSDNGTGLMRTLTPDDFGVGLSNVFSRLNRIYGDNMTFDVSGVWGAGATATIELECVRANEGEAVEASASAHVNVEILSNGQENRKPVCGRAEAVAH